MSETKQAIAKRIRRSGWGVFIIGMAYSSLIQIWNNVLFKLNIIDKGCQCAIEEAVKTNWFETNSGFIIATIGLAMIFHEVLLAIFRKK